MDNGQNPDCNSNYGPEQSYAPMPISPHGPQILGEQKTNPAESKKGEANAVPSKTRLVEWLQFLVNGLLAVIGVIALCIYGGQLNVMKGQLGEIIKQFPELQKSADAAKKAADTAENMFNDNKDSFGKTLTEMQKQSRAMQDAAKYSGESVRARFSIENTLVTAPAVDQIPLDRIHYTNIGHSTAAKVLVWFESERWAKLPDREMILPENHDPAIPVEPGGEGYIQRSDKKLTEKDIEQMDSGEMEIYFFGRITYESLGKKHHTDWCFHTMSPTRPFNPEMPLPPGSMPLFACPKWWNSD